MTSEKKSKEGSNVTNSHDGKVFEINVNETLCENLKLSDFSNEFIKNNKYEVFRLSMLFHKSHLNYCDVAIPFYKSPISFDEITINFENNSFNIKQKSKNSFLFTKKCLTEKKKKKNNLKNKNKKQKTEDNLLEVVVEEEVQEVDEIYILELDEPVIMYSKIWLISSGQINNVIKIYDDKPEIAFQCSINARNVEQNELIFSKENFQSIRGNLIKYFPKEILKVIYHKNEEKIILTLKYENEEEFTKALEKEIYEGNIIIYFNSDISFELKKATEKLDGLFIAKRNFNFKQVYDENTGDENCLYFCDLKMNVPSVDILKGELIFLEIKNNLNAAEALNQSIKHLIDLRSLCFDKDAKIHILIILNGESDKSNVKRDFTSKISKIKNFKNITLMIGILNKSIFFKVDTKKSLKSVVEINRQLILINRSILDLKDEILEKVNDVVKSEMKTVKEEILKEIDAKFILYLGMPSLPNNIQK